MELAINTLISRLKLNTVIVDLFDLPRTLQRKPSRKRPERKVDRQCYIGRTYKDFLQWIEDNPRVAPVEMDRVKA